jgi:hypothetical protein
MTRQAELRIERRSRFYGGGHSERNAAPTPAEAVDMLRRAAEIDAEIAARRPELRSAMRAPAQRSSGPDRAYAELQLRARRLELLKLGSG